LLHLFPFNHSASPYVLSLTPIEAYIFWVSSTRKREKSSDKAKRGVTTYPRRTDFGQRGPTF
jgi:hypothetical protein